MKLKSFMLGLLSVVLAFPTFSQDLLITGIFDGPLSGGTPKGVELYVVNDIADLSLYGIGTSFNAGTSSGADFTFPAVAVTSGTYIYCTANDTQFDDFFGFSEDYIVSALSINGDDTVELFFNGAVIDVYGSIGTDGSGEAWEYLDSWSYRVDGTSGSTTWTAADWIIAGTNVYDGTSTNAGATPAMPVGTYSASGSATPGCTDINACNYDAAATVDNGSCLQIGAACDDMDAATVDDEYQSDCSCAGVANVPGCMDSGACNYNAAATSDDGSCDYACLGCTDNTACNYDMAFTIDDGSCAFIGDSCDDMNAATVGDEYQGDCSCSGIIPTLTNALMITAVYDGPLSGGVPKGIELYALADIADLSTFGVGSANNGGGTDGQEYTFPADAITAGTYIYVSSDDAGAQTYFATVATNYNAGSTMSINGDDAIELFEFGSVIDTFGDINTDGSGEAWDYLDSWAHRNCEQMPNAGTFVSTNWTYGGINVLDGTALNSESASPMPVGAFETTCPSVIPGCTNAAACNFNMMATTDDGSCELIGDTCDDGNNLTENDVLQGDCSCAGTAVVTCDPISWSIATVATNSEGDVWIDNGDGSYSANGYCGSGCTETIDLWLVSNGFDYSAVTISNLLFDLAESFEATTLDLQYTTAYAGDPSTSSWTSLGTYDTAGSFNADLSALAGLGEVYIAFQYADDGADGYSGFTLSNLALIGDCPADVTVFDCPTEMTNFGDACDDGDAMTNNDVVQPDCTCAGTPFVLSNDLMITAVFDGPLSGGTPKGIELYVVNDIADLSIFGLASITNGQGSPGQEYTFPADAATAGDFIYVTANDTEFDTFFGFGENYSNGVLSVNGDDAIELYEQGVVIDVYGDINTDGTGEAWEYLDGWAYRNCETGPNGGTFDSTNWTFSGANALDNEVDNASAASPVPVGTFMTTCPPMGGCTDPLYVEYDPYAEMEDGSCLTLVVEGCIYDAADNYDPSANTDDNSCIFSGNACPGDFNDDQLVTAFDLSQFLSVFGSSCN